MKKEADEAAEAQNTGRYHRLMPDDDDGVNESYRSAFVDEGVAPAAQSQRYGGIGGSRTHAADEMLAATGQDFGSLRDDGVAHLGEFHTELEDEEGAWYDQDANDVETSAKIEEQDQGLFDAAAEEEGDDEEEEDESGKPLTEKQRRERLQAARVQEVEAHEARERDYERTVRGGAAAAAKAAAAMKEAAAAARASKKRSREEAGGAVSSSTAMGPPLPRSGGPPAAKSSRLGVAALASTGSAGGGRRDPFDGSVNPKTAITEEIKRELISHGMSCQHRIMVNFLRSRIRACGAEYKTIALAALKRLATQEKNAQGETVYKLRREFWKQ